MACKYYIDGLTLSKDEFLNYVKKQPLEESSKILGISTTPSAPFITDTNAYVKLGMRFALKEAVKQGATKIAWTSGEQQNDRYDLSKQVDWINAEKTQKGDYKIEVGHKDNRPMETQYLKENELEPNLGKELATKIINDGGGMYKGLDLKVGGKGMKGFYGSPNVRKPILFEDANGNKIVFEKGDYRISVDNENNAKKAVLWHKEIVNGKEYWAKRGVLNANISESRFSEEGDKDFQKYLKISEVEIEKEHRGNRLGQELYKAIIDYAGSDVKALISYTPSRVNKREVPNIWKRLGAREMKDNVDYQVIDLNKQENLGIVGNVAKSLFKQEPKTTTIKGGKGSIDATSVDAIWVEDNGKILPENKREDYKFNDNEFVFTIDNNVAYRLYDKNDIKDAKNRDVYTIPRGNYFTQHSIDITPELKVQVELGLPLFAMASTTIPLIEDIKQAPELGISKVAIARRSFPIEYNILKNKIKGRMNALGDTVPKSIAVSDFLIEYMNDLLNRTSKNADGTEKRFAFVDKLENMRNSLSSASNTPLLESIYDHIQDGTPITKKASEILSTLTDYHIQFQNVIAMNDAVAIDNDTIYDRDEFKSQALSELKKGRDAVQLKKLEGSKYGKYIAIGIEKYTLAVSSLSTWAKLLAGGENSMLNKLVKTLDAAQDKQYVMAETARDMINGLQKKIGKGSTFNSNDILKSATQQIGTIFSNHKGDNTLISEGELLHMYLTLKNDVARARFFDGGGNGIFELKEFRDKQNKVLRKNVSLNITSADYKTLENRFASADWQSKIDDWTKANKFLYNYVNDVHLQDTGTALKQVPGFYYPLVHGDGIKSYEDYLTSNKFMDDLRSTKSRSPEKNANYLVVDAMQLMNTYINTNSKYAAYAMPLKNIDVYLKEADSFIRDNDMLRYVEWYNKFKKEFEDPSPDKLGEIGKRLLSGFVISRLGLNPFVTLKQYSSLFIANNVIPYKYIISSLDVLGKNAGGVIKSFVPGLKVEFDDVMNEMLEHSATARRRLNAGQNYFDELVKSGIKDYETVVFGKNIKVPFSKMTQNISAADRAVSSVYWVAAKKQVESETSLSIGSKEYWNAVNDIYLEAVVQSQSSIDDVNRAHITKDANILVKGLTLFSGQAFSNYNSFMGSVIEHANNPNSSNKMRVARSIMNVYVYNALMVAAIDSLKYAQNGDDEDKLKKKAMRSMISNSYQNLPILAPIIDEVWTKIDNPRLSRDINYPVLQVINDGASLIGNLANEKYERAVIEGIKFGAEGIGIPMYPFDAANKIITKK